MNRRELEEKINACIFEAASKRNLQLKTISPSQELVGGLGFKSMELMILLKVLEEKFGRDPFYDNCASITDLRFVKDLYNVYAKALDVKF